MSGDHYYHKDERLVLRIAVILGLIALILVFLFAQSTETELIPISDPSVAAEAHAGVTVDEVSPVEVWAEIEVLALEAELDPQFIYAIAWAESSLNVHARSSAARGLMQITRPAWVEVTDEPYSSVFDWQENLRVGVDYLAFCRDFLDKHDAFSYPLLAACYRYGPYHVKGRGFSIERLDTPENDIYRSIFSGSIHPVAPPVEEGDE